MLRLLTLGGLDLSAETNQVHPLLSQPKRLALLVYLSATNSHGYRRRDAILPVFWPELDQDRARNALRQALYVLRRDLGDGVIRLHGEEELGVDPAKLWVDVTAFETAFTAREYRTSADLYRGDFLEGFFVSGASAAFDEWVAGERSRLRGLASRAIWAAADAAVAREPEAAAGWIRKALALAPDDELAVRQALDQLMRIGDRAGALHVYHEFRDRLDREFSAEPATETKAMAEALRLSRDPSPTVRPEAALPTEQLVASGAQQLDRLPHPRLSGALGPADIAPRNPAVRSGRRALAGVLSAAALAIAWSVYQVRTGSGSSLSSGSPPAVHEILVGDIKARSEDSLAARALTALLRTHLGASPAVRVVPAGAIDQSLIRMKLPASTRIEGAVAREMAFRDGYEAVLSTELTPLAGGFVVSAHLTTVSGKELATATEPATTPDALIPAVDRVARSLWSQLGESHEALVEIPPLQQVTTWSIRALELFTQAQDISNVSRGRGQQPQEMMELLREALTIDSTFAMAHRRLAAAFHNLGFVRESMQEFRAAERFSGRLTEVERLTALVSLHLSLGEYDRTLAEASALLRLDPGNLFAQNWLANLYFGFGKYDLAEEQIPRIAPVGEAFWTSLREYQGRGAEALDSARAFHDRHQGSTTSLAFRRARHRLATVHALRYAYDSAVVHAMPRDVSDSGAPLILAASRFAQGRVAEALAIQTLRARTPDSETRGSTQTSAESYTALATMLITSNRASASRRLDRVLADTSYRSREPANRHIRPILALAVAGRAADARRELVAIERGSNADVRTNRALDLDLARGAVALSEQSPVLAIEALRRAGTKAYFGSFDACRVCTLPWLGRAYEDAGRPDSAAAVYERFLSTGDPFRVLVDASWRAVVLRRVAELHARRGDTALAVTRFSQFLELWKNADPELQPQVERVRRRVADLRTIAVAR